jgi:hypothetical protein
MLVNSACQLMYEGHVKKKGMTVSLKSELYSTVLTFVEDEALLSMANRVAVTVQGVN